MAKKRVVFSFYAPQALSVEVTGSFCNWTRGSFKLKKDDSGVWKRSINLDPGRYEYRFLVDGVWHEDPGNEQKAGNPFGSFNNVITL